MTLFLDEKIWVVDTRHFKILVNEFQFDRPFDLQSRTAQLVGETRHIRLFEQALDDLSSACVELAGCSE